MSLPSTINELLMGSAASYSINNSLRFRSSSSAYLNRTPASAGNTRIWTWSGWVKRSSLNSAQNLMVSGTTSNQATMWMGFGYTYGPQGCLEINGGINGVSSDFWAQTYAVFRDPSAWYHIVFAMDTTLATPSNRLKIFVNGVQQQLTSYASYSAYPSLNFSTTVNSTTPHRICSDPANYGVYFDGYLAEVNFIDGQQLPATFFGETDAITGVWKPKKYSGPYGTNGFYLKFNNGSSTTTLGYDSSGNGNNWTTNNLSLTSGATYDWMLDSPTSSSSTIGNYCVLNPLEKLNWLSQNGSFSISDGNLSVTNDMQGNMGCGSISVSSGKWYFETTLTSYVFTGIRSIRAIPTGDVTYRYYQGNGGITYTPYNSTSQTTLTTVATSTSGVVIGVAFDLDAGTISWYKNGSLLYTATGIVSDTYTPAIGAAANQSGVAVNFGQRPWAYTPPTGYKALQTYNLPDPTIKQGNKHFDVTLYTGNGTSQSITNVGGFQPDFVWVKDRSAVNNHGLFDSVRGVSKALRSNLVDAEDTTSGVTSFNSSGFTLGSAFNQSSDSFVSWQWKAGGTKVTNTYGSITSQVSANPTAGFSVVTWTGNGTDGATVGHGLGVKPDFTIIKKRANNTATNTGNWICQHKSTTAGVNANSSTFTLTSYTNGALYLNGTYALSSYGFDNQVNGNTDTFVAYCFAAIPGFSTFGSYTGNGSADGTFVNCGFRPAFIIRKKTNGTGDWFIQDSKRPGDNQAGSNGGQPGNDGRNWYFWSNSSNAESSTFYGIDILSNGFKVRTGEGNHNGSGDNFIYAAFAENPFKYSLAR